MSKFDEYGSESDNSELGGIMDSMETLDIASDQAVAGQDSISTNEATPIETFSRPGNPIKKHSDFKQDELILPTKKRVAMKSKILLKPIGLAKQEETSRPMIHNKSREDLIGENRKKKKQNRRNISSSTLSSAPDDDSDITVSDDEEIVIDDLIDEPIHMYTQEMLSDHLSDVYSMYDEVEPKLQRKLIQKLENTLKIFNEKEIQYQEIKNLIDTLEPEYYYGKKGNRKRTYGGGTVKRKRNKKTKRTKKATFKKHVKTTKKRKTRKTKKRKKTLKKQH